MIGSRWMWLLGAAVGIITLATILWLIAMSPAIALTHRVAPTADPLATQTTINEQIYLSLIGRRASHQIIVGQYTGTVYGTGTWDSQYPIVITALHNSTGQYPGLVGWSYEDINPDHPGQPVDYTEMNAQIIADWNAGSLIEITYNPANPWTNGSYSDTSCGSGGALPDLINPSKAIYTTWRNKLASVAAALQALQAAGVTVIWRPLPEFNWTTNWAAQCMPWPSSVNYANYIAVWRDMFTLFTQTYGLHNLLWSFAPQKVTDIASWPRPYPGAAYVDIVGWDWYDDPTTPVQLAFPHWRDIWANFGKIIAYNERGPYEIDGTSTMYETLLSGMVNNAYSSMPIGAFFMSWNAGWAIQANPGANALMNDSRAATRANVASVMNCMSGATTYAQRAHCALTN
jgi:mannan endo-1,4-beta-mannosidase